VSAGFLEETILFVFVPRCLISNNYLSAFCAPFHQLSILKAMIIGGPMGIDDSDLQFTIEVLRDAKKLDWEAGQFETRNRAVRGVLVGRMSEVWKENADDYGMGFSNDNEEDQLFKKKGWNKVDSGFRLWGGGNAVDKQSRKSEAVDDFLKSKGWNDVDSGFRII
jgi:hypothetical protein